MRRRRLPARCVGATRLFQTINSDGTDLYGSNESSSVCLTIQTNRLTSASGKAVCRYALGGAARSAQPESLALKYRDIISQHDEEVAPFYFYYNPHRYPAFLSGVRQTFTNDEIAANNHRKDLFLASGGTERSPTELDERLKDALVHSGGDYLDAFVIEYVCPYELASDKHLEKAIDHVHNMKKQGKVRYVIASTHSHYVGSALASATLPDGKTPAFDGLMLRYSMSHKNGAESLSLPSALERNIPVLAFTTTRWNRLQSDPPIETDSLPSTADCIKFSLDHPAVEVVLHSARDEEELEEAMMSLLSSSSSGQSTWLSEEECNRWRTYGDDEGKWNEDDQFDEYPEEAS
ncbi:hypothetical protein ACHAXR_002395 [Thalassiosira sp. AJA248-18]